jgi:D-sedoheptulose 7-phosphate isomerase
MTEDLQQSSLSEVSEPGEFFNEYFASLGDRLNTVSIDHLLRSVEMILAIHESGGKVILAGNGGSAAMASHVSVDFTKAAAIRAVTFNEADLITCFANDYGYEHWVSSALRHYADQRDLVILISSSGQSMNIVNAANEARTMGLKLITFSGFAADNPLRQIGDLNFWVDSSSYNIVEMTHHVWLVALVDFIIDQGRGF